MKNKELYGWVFTYNPYEKLYLCTNRDNYHKLFDNQQDESIIKSSSISSLEEIIIKHKGDLKQVIQWKHSMNSSDSQ